MARRGWRCATLRQSDLLRTTGSARRGTERSLCCPITADTLRRGHHPRSRTAEPRDHGTGHWTLWTERDVELWPDAALRPRVAATGIWKGTVGGRQPPGRRAGEHRVGAPQDQLERPQGPHGETFTVGSSKRRGTPSLPGSYVASAPAGPLSVMRIIVGSGWGAAPWPSSAGTRMRQCRPERAKSSEIAPPICAARPRSSSRVPNPRLGGRPGSGGPPGLLPQHAVPAGAVRIRLCRAPGQPHPPGSHRQRAVLGRVGRKLVERHPERHSRTVSSRTPKARVISGLVQPESVSRNRSRPIRLAAIP
jgi:hypothetical protein